ncbi:MAG: BBP7 family outer membrane beta-barrel protein [Mariniblastus sp.]
MNYKFKINLVAIVATLSGTLSACQAVQVEGQLPFGSGVIRPAEPPMVGAFGAVRPAIPTREPGQDYALPPIVSADSSGSSASQQMLENVPPIVTPGQARTDNPPMMANVPPIVPPIVVPDQMGQPATEVPKSGPETGYPNQTPGLLYHKNQRFARADDSQESNAPAIVDQRTYDQQALAQPLPTPSMKSPMEIASQMSAMPLPKLQAPLEYEPSYEDGPMFAPSQMELDSSQIEVGYATNGTSTEDVSELAQAAQWRNGAGSGNGISSGGVPIYQSSAPALAMPPIVQGADSSSQVPIVQGNTAPMPPIIGAESQMISPAPMLSSPPPMANSVMSQPMQTAIDPSYGQTYFNAPSMEAPVISSPGCSSCNSSACGGGCSSVTSMAGSGMAGGGCSSCSGGGCNDCGIANSGLSVSNCPGCGDSGCCNQETVTSRFNSCGSISGARRYLLADALFFTRDDGLIANSNFGALNSFDYEAGARITLGSRSDSTRGREISYMGVLPLEESTFRTDALARMNARFSGADGFSGIETSAFRNSVEQTESKETNIHSLEFNQVRWGWDVVKTFVGMRYFYLDDSYQMTSRNNLGETGSFSLETNNNMIGPHIGGELFYDVGYRWSYSVIGKAGVYANFNKVDTSLINNGAQFINVEDDNVTVAGSLELGLIGHYQLTQRSRLRAGYQLLWLGEVASASDNFNPVLTPTTGTSSSDSDDMFFHGLSVGLEIYR